MGRPLSAQLTKLPTSVKKLVTKYGGFDEMTNLSPGICARLNRNLHLVRNHPIGTLRHKMQTKLTALGFQMHFNTECPVVEVKDNFDMLGFPPNHPGRSKSDTYYLNKKYCLRTHTSTHQIPCMKKFPMHQHIAFSVSADVFRRDEIDRQHYPVFHQLEGFFTWPEHQLKTHVAQRLGVNDKFLRDVEYESIGCDAYHATKNPIQPLHQKDLIINFVVPHLMTTLELLIVDLIAPRSDRPISMRWVPARFPFTSPSYELELYFNGKWIEVLGCGVVHNNIVMNANRANHCGWAFGIGLDRLAMILYGINDIRVLWDQDPRITAQWKKDEIHKFRPISRFPACYQDISMWLPLSHVSNAPKGVSSSVSHTPEGDSHAPKGVSNVSNAPKGDSSTDSNDSNVSNTSINTPKGDSDVSNVSNTPKGDNQGQGETPDEYPEEETERDLFESNFLEICRSIGGDLIEDVTLIDDYFDEKTRRQSRCYRLMYRSMTRTLLNDEIVEIQDQIAKEATKKLGITPRL